MASFNNRYAEQFDARLVQGANYFAFRGVLWMPQPRPGHFRLPVLKLFGQYLDIPSQPFLVSQNHLHRHLGAEVRYRGEGEQKTSMSNVRNNWAQF